MHIQILGYAEFCSRAASHPTVSKKQADSPNFTREWTNVRRAVVTFMSRFGRQGELGQDHGDFLVHDDCFGIRRIGVGALSWKILTEQVIGELQVFLMKVRPEYSVGISYDLAASDVEFFHIFLTRDEAVLSVNNKSRSEAQVLCFSHSVLSRLPLK